MYVLKCTNNGRFTGAFVARSGSRHSYTFNILNAKKYTSKESAMQDACGNEYPVSVDNLLY